METQPEQPLRERLDELTARHRELDAEIARMEGISAINQLELQRMKKQKLRMKDTIERLRTLLIPDLNA